MTFSGGGRSCMSVYIYFLAHFLHWRVLLWKYIFSGFKFAELAMSKQLFSWSFIDDYILFALTFAAEVVLSLLIESFEFTPSNKEIFWQMSKLVTPIVVGEGMRPQLPVVVKLVVHHKNFNFGLEWFGVYPCVYLTSYVYATFDVGGSIKLHLLMHVIFTCVWS
jgi:hypothetical protein